MMGYYQSDWERDQQPYPDGVVKPFGCTFRFSGDSSCYRAVDTKSREVHDDGCGGRRRSISPQLRSPQLSSDQRRVKKRGKVAGANDADLEQDVAPERTKFHRWSSCAKDIRANTSCRAALQRLHNLPYRLIGREAVAKQVSTARLHRCVSIGQLR